MKLLQWLKRLFMALSAIIKNFFNSLCCADPCAGKQGYTTAVLNTSFAEFFGGTGDLPTQWEVVQNGVVTMSGTLPAGNNLIDDILPVGEYNCFTLRWKSPCDNNWHEQQSVACEENPCAGFEPFTDFDYDFETLTLTGGNAIGTTAWEVVQDGSVVASGTLQPGESSFTVPGFNPATCQTIRFKGSCEGSWHEFTIGDCADPCAGFEPFTDFDYDFETLTLTGGNAIGTTAWEVVQDGSVVASGTLQPGESSFTVPGFNPATCQTIRFKGSCEGSWHEFTIGDCTPAYLAPGNYSMDYGAVTGVCNIELSISRLPEARDAAIAAGQRIKCNWTANNDNGSLPCSYTGETIFEPTDGTIDLGVYDISCGGISACSMMGSFTINSLEIVP